MIIRGRFVLIAYRERERVALIGMSLDDRRGTHLCGRLTEARGGPIVKCARFVFDWRYDAVASRIITRQPCDVHLSEVNK